MSRHRPKCCDSVHCPDLPAPRSSGEARARRDQQRGRQDLKDGLQYETDRSYGAVFPYLCCAECGA